MVLWLLTLLVVVDDHDPWERDLRRKSKVPRDAA
jgi:hypothetical protein